MNTQKRFIIQRNVSPASRGEHWHYISMHFRLCDARRSYNVLRRDHLPSAGLRILDETGKDVTK